MYLNEEATFSIGLHEDQTSSFDVSEKKSPSLQVQGKFQDAKKRIRTIIHQNITVFIIAALSNYARYFLLSKDESTPTVFSRIITILKESYDYTDEKIINLIPVILKISTYDDEAYDADEKLPPGILQHNPIGSIIKRENIDENILQNLFPKTYLRALKKGAMLKDIPNEIKTLDFYKKALEKDLIILSGVPSNDHPKLLKKFDRTKRKKIYLKFIKNNHRKFNEIPLSLRSATICLAEGYRIWSPIFIFYSLLSLLADLLYLFIPIKKNQQ